MAAVAVVLAAALPSTAGSAIGIRYGDHGLAVVLLQQRLTELGYLGDGAADGIFGDETWHAVVAFQGWQRIPRDGVVGPITLRALATAERPRPWVHLNRALEIDLARQVLLEVRHGTVVRVLHASTGAPRFATPPGRFAIIRRQRRSWSRPYHVWLLDALYFDRGWAIHGFPRVPDQPASHGCIRIPLPDARALFSEVALGTPVIIRGRPTAPPPIPSHPNRASGRRRSLTPRLD